MILGGCDLVAEGNQSDDSQLEVLFGEGNADDGDGTQRHQDEVHDRELQSGHQYPDHVHDDVERVVRLGPRADLAPERPDGKAGDLQGLDAEGNPDDGEHQQDAPDQIEHKDDQPTEDHPQYVAECRHGIAHL